MGGAVMADIPSSRRSPLEHERDAGRGQKGNDMTTESDGGPAFPQPDLSGYGMGPVEGPNGEYRMNGISKLEYFAGQALIGIGTWMPIPSSGVPSLALPETQMARARWAVSQAQAMLRAISEQSGKEPAE
jgi:hypothetical protein